MSQKPKKSFKGQNMTINIRYCKPEMVSSKDIMQQNNLFWPRMTLNDCPSLVHLTLQIRQWQNMQKTTRHSAAVDLVDSTELMH